MIPTKGDYGRTVATFFINNGRRYLAFGNFFYIRVPSEDHFNEMKYRLTNNDWPLMEIAETDPAIYGVEIGANVTSLVNNQPYTQGQMIAFIDNNINELSRKIDALTELVKNK